MTGVIFSFLYSNRYLNKSSNIILAEFPGVAHENNNKKFLAYVTFRVPMGSLKKNSAFGLAVWPAIGNIIINVLFYFIDIYFARLFDCPDKAQILCWTCCCCCSH